MHVFVWLKSPVVAIELIVTWFPNEPVLYTMTVCCAAVVPSSCDGKTTDCGCTVSAGPDVTNPNGIERHY